MKKQAERGIHQGWHGKIVDVVRDFHVEVFSSITNVPASLLGAYACEI